MSEPSKLATLAWRFASWSWMTLRRWRFFFWITPGWLNTKFQMYMFRQYAERYPDVMERQIREAMPQEMRQRRSEEELVVWSKRTLHILLHPEAHEQILAEKVRKRRFSQSGPQP